MTTTVKTVPVPSVTTLAIPGEKAWAFAALMSFATGFAGEVNTLWGNALCLLLGAALTWALFRDVCRTPNRLIALLMMALFLTSWTTLTLLATTPWLELMGVEKEIFGMLPTVFFTWAGGSLIYNELSLSSEGA